MDIFTRDYSTDLSTVAKVRADIVAIFNGHPAVEDVRLIISELAANAAEHGTGDTYTVTVTRYPTGDPREGLRVTVTNKGGANFPPRKADLWRTRGRGRWIVQILAPSTGGAWGNDQTTIWFAFPDTQTAAQPALMAA